MCRGNNHNGRRCPASTNPIVRKEQNAAYYLKRKAAGTVGVRLTPQVSVNGMTEDLSHYRNLPDATEMVLFNTTEVEQNFGVGLENMWKPSAFTGTDEMWERAKDYAKRLGDGFSTTITTPDFVTVDCVTESVMFGRNREDKQAISIKGVLTISGQYAGIWERAIICAPEPYMDYNKLTVGENHRGKKLGTQLIAHFDNATRATGLTTVKTYANMDIGGYAWAKAGYDWDKTVTNDEMFITKNLMDAKLKLWAVNTETVDGGKAEQKEINDMRERLNGDRKNPDYPTPFEVAMCGRDYAVKGLWAGKQALLRSGWDGVRKL